MGCGRPSLSFSTGPKFAGCSLQTLQTLRNFHTGSWSCQETCQTGSWSCQTMGRGRPSLSFATGPIMADAPFKPSKRSETSKPALGAAKLWAVAGQVLSFLPARNCRMLPSNPPNAPKLPNRPLELPNYGLWQAKSCLFYRPETAIYSLQTLQTLRNFQTGSWSCHEIC